MKTITASTARAQLYNLVDQVATSHPVQITGKRHNAILISSDDWEAIQETLYLLSVPNLRESLLDGKETPVEACLDEDALEL